MAISVHTNYASLVTQNTLQSTNSALTKSMEKLSTGFRINSAADDAAGLQIANRLEAQSRGMNVAMRNSQDAISMMQTAEGAFDEMTNIAYRMNDLAVQYANGTNSTADQTAIDVEFNALSDELANIASNTNFGGTNLLTTGSFGAGAVVFQIGTSSTETLSVDASTEVGAVTGHALAAGGGALTAASNIDALSGAGGLIELLGTARAEFGANINRLEHTITNLGNMTENLESSKGRIMDTDFASESGMMSKQQMLMQSGASMLSASKMVPQLAMSLLG
ncbi:lateral flagellin LafA [Vibrio campbellii]|uniref:lateral flagellin LafA n=1 Tax=Vibrio sp. Isolate22 TaxID=2908532 RepID=UPI001EFE0C46|nr:lateral flagellin LafA [Vibrio sp. Isolate22]MCG9690350.1 lateral flagellin LafA [Vibrio sp. Isolate22]